MSSAKLNETQVGGTHYQDATGVCPACGAPIQHWDLFAKMPYLVAQVCKYVLRFAGKNGKQDIEKAEHFLAKLKAVYYPEWPLVDPANPSLNPRDYAATPGEPHVDTALNPKYYTLTPKECLNCNKAVCPGTSYCASHQPLVSGPIDLEEIKRRGVTDSVIATTYPLIVNSTKPVYAEELKRRGVTQDAIEWVLHLPA